MDYNLLPQAQCGRTRFHLNIAQDYELYAIVKLVTFGSYLSRDGAKHNISNLLRKPTNKIVGYFQIVGGSLSSAKWNLHTVCAMAVNEALTHYWYQTESNHN